MGPIKRILIADAHHAIRTGLRALLETRPDLEVVAEAATGREALEAARRSPPDIAIVAYALPELNGSLLCRELRKVAPETYILIYTVLDDEKTIRDALQAGASGFVNKSDTESDLFAAIDAVAEGGVYFSPFVSNILQWQPRKPSDESEPSLTLREQEVVQLIAEGKHHKEIAGLLGLSVKTVQAHRATVMKKLNLDTTVELVRYALRNNIATQ